MTSLEKDILLYILYTPRHKDDVVAYVKRFRPLRRKPDDYAINKAFDTLEDGYINEELGKEELAARRRGEEYSGIVSDFCNVFAATDPGVEIGEDLQEDRQRFWLPIIISSLISLLSLVVSLAVSLASICR